MHFKMVEITIKLVKLLLYNYQHLKRQFLKRLSVKVLAQIEEGLIMLERKGGLQKDT
jgi:hypothetical protein